MIEVAGLDGPTVQPEYLALVGLRGAGKTTLGGALAAELRLPPDTSRDEADGCIHDILETVGVRKVAVLTVPMLMPNGSAGWISLELGARAGRRILPILTHE